MLAELYRVLRPGGRISFSDFSLGSPGDPARVARFMDTLKLRRLHHGFFAPRKDQVGYVIVSVRKPR